MTKPLIIVIAGPTGVGKTTLAKMLSKYFNFVYISEDEVTREIFPDQYQNIEDYPDKFKIAESQLFKKVRENFENGISVMIDRINLSQEFIEEMKKVFHKHLILKILWPSVEITIERDKKREGWISGERIIKGFYQKYEELKPIIGEENYIDTSNQTPKETLEQFIAAIEQNK